MRNVVALIGASVLAMACGTGAPPSVNSAATTAAAAVQTSPPAVPQTTAPAPRTSPGRTPTASRNPAHAEVILRWDAGAIISDIDDVTDMVTHLRNTPGIIDGFGDESQITILYDPQLTTVEKIRRTLQDMGFPTRSPSP